MTPPPRLVLALSLALACAGPARAAGSPGQISHAIAMQGKPALPPDFACLPYADPHARKGGILHLGELGTFANLNPYGVNAGDAAAGLAGPVYESLMARSFDEPFTLYGLVAQSIETDDARDYVVFRLDPKAHFSDGVPITARDVLFSFNLLKAKGRPQQRAAYGLVHSIQALDDHTVRYDLAGADDRELPLILALMPVLPAHVMTEKRFTDQGLAIPVGSGPYKVAEVRPGERLDLRRDPNYWGRDLPINCGLYNFDEVVFDYGRDDNSLFEAFKAGLIDYRQETDPHRWASGYGFPARRDGRVAVESLPLGGPKGLSGFAFNTRRALFKDPRLREALAMMFDFEWLNANLFSNLYTRDKSFFDESELSASGSPASAAERKLLAPYPGAVRADIMNGSWSPPRSDGSGRDRELAKKALALAHQAGWTLQDGRLTRNGQQLNFEILVRDREQERLALYYSDLLRRIGVEARVRLVDDAQFEGRRQRFDFDMMIGLWQASASPGNEQRMRWGGDSASEESSYNLAGAKSPAIDAMIAALLAARGREDFVTAARALDRVLLSGFYVVPLYHSHAQWIAYWRRIAHPKALPHYAQPLFGDVLETWSLAPGAAAARH
ncbi:extracellular solute-binding protein [Rhodoblastus acidophilus]|uniref:Extracellular solute-binding protein n=1 Tax=Candidatus Rhodoblastus alkanivorans TaxID=2954117 RepID=A0ABS9Z5A5_9HYPH|nr:extracellular solute-binding protein [Candidatus Rhodoblastus alkanivorans]MCI4678473.1 extracellular solute-binding protein [Candidatus Rhodoblastus alkanivorans]MCI4682854.1 extracellular solute-binding protein [Candidatus Rhodoblastus alkanivorans]MDI4640163.1 extracellular solute-binding protein [Rhodoblastus acidophilus]